MTDNSHFPEVSVLMPAFNREIFIAESIKSILNQTFSNFEFIILDDGSTDNTIKKLFEFDDNRIRILKNEINKGISYSRNKLLKEARGKFIAFLDSDDIALPTRLEIQVAFLKEHKQTLLVGSPCLFINKNGRRKKTKLSFLTPLASDPEEIKATLLFRNSFAQSSIMINKELLKSKVEYDEGYPVWEDFKLWVKLANENKLQNLKQPLVMYRSYAENISHSFADPYKMQLFNKVIVKQFKTYFNYIPTEEELFIHAGWYFNSNRIDSNYLLKSKRWLFKIKELNSMSKVFDEKLFDKVLKRNWFDRCWHIFDKGYPIKVLHFLFFNLNLSFRDVFIFFYFLSKNNMHFTKANEI